tara:strand:+ start:41 stop:157 length:117 start_codon:yes stop_codon:yes gene_type:complete
MNFLIEIWESWKRFILSSTIYLTGTKELKEDSLKKYEK